MCRKASSSPRGFTTNRTHIIAIGRGKVSKLQCRCLCLVGGELVQHLSVPFCHSVDLSGGLESAVGNVSLGPLGESAGDLLNASHRVGSVVSSLRSGNVAVGFASLSWSAVFARLVVKSALFKALLHSRRVSVEFGSPVGGLLVQVVAHPLVGELVELVQALKRVSGRHLF